jgi:2-dehydro-3-deoxyphosphogluconate aldolase / (4S)-4-hydroxy-2-oxoglutarate aldolase
MKKRSDVLATIRRSGVVPAIRVSSSEQVCVTIDGLYEGGILVAEVAMSMQEPLRCLEKALRHGEGRMVLGAGTVLDPETARACILAGAEFIVSPNLDVRTIELCKKYSVAVFPGAFTPTEILAAWSAGADCVKVFPASAGGGAHYIGAIKAPLPQVELMPMGGVSIDTAEDYMRAGSFAVGVGSDLANNGMTIEAVATRARAYRMKVEPFCSERT